MIKAVLIDAGGVLLYNNTSLYDTISAHLKGDIESVRDLVKPFIISSQLNKISRVEFWNSLSEIFNIKKDEIEDICMSEYIENLSLDMKVQEIIYKIKTPVCLFSNIASVYKDLALDFTFDEKIISYEVGLRKPQEKIYEKSINLFRCDRSEILIIDDLEKNLYGAKGFEGYKYDGSTGLRVYLESRNLL